MSAALRRIAIAIAAIAPCVAVAQDNAIVVCGQALDRTSSLSWQSAVKAAGNRGNVAAFRILKERYEAASFEWPRAIAEPAVEAFAALDERREKVANFQVMKSGGGNSPIPVQGVFHGQPYFVELPIAGDSPSCAPAEAKTALVELATVVQGVSDAVGAFGSGAMTDVADRVSELERKFDRYLFDGFPMFPWEAAVNSWALTNKHLVEGPPRNQIVFAHPAAGLVVSAADDAKSDIGGTLSVEPIGWVRYRKDYRHWMGVSLLAVFPADRDAGYGVAFNYDMFKLGVTWHDDDTGVHDGVAVFVGLDFYRFLDSKYREYDGYRDRLRAIAKSSSP